jgi:hypothetical protein
VDGSFGGDEPSEQKAIESFKACLSVDEDEKSGLITSCDFLERSGSGCSMGQMIWSSS